MPTDWTKLDPKEAKANWGDILKSASAKNKN